MPLFLSDEWVAEFNQSVASLEPIPQGAEAGLAVQGGKFSLAQLVESGPGGPVHTVLRVDGGAVVLHLVDRGEPSDADVSIRLSWDDAVSLAQGRLSVVQAINEGRVKVRGDLSALAAGSAVLAQAQHHLASLHSVTTF